ncbi:MAG: hypothetical protein ACOVQA_06660 [Thermoflexibacteraceae bacterium]
MSDLSKVYENIINTLDVPKFTAVVKTFIELYYKLEQNVAIDIIKVDGSGDGGLDLKFFVNKFQRKLPIQLTVQKTELERKVIKDVVKITDLVINYGYEPILLFFCSQNISETKINALTDKARREYSIDLKIIDAKFIGEIAANENYVILKNKVFEQLGIPVIKEKLQLDDTKKMMYDLISYGNDTAEIKNQIINSFLLHTIYTQKNISESNLCVALNKQFNLKNTISEQVTEKLNDKFIIKKATKDNKNKEIDFCKQQFSRLVALKKITNTGENISLTASEIQRIENVKEEFLLQENYFVKQITEILEKYDLQDKYSLFIDEIIKYFKSYFRKDFEEINQDLDSVETELSDNNSGKSFYTFTLKQVGKREIATVLSNELLELCQKNDFVQRICAGEVFAKFTQPDKLQQYVNEQEKVVYLDTQIVLYILCVAYSKTKAISNNPYYNSAVDFIEYLKKDTSAKVFVHRNYIEEAANHVKEAFALIFYTKIADFNIKDLGGSANIFFNFYHTLLNNNLLSDGVLSYEDFLIDFGFEQRQSIRNISDIVADILGQLGIKVFLKNYDSGTFFESIKKNLQNIYSMHPKYSFRSETTAEKDAQMLCILYDNNNKIEKTIFITWDTSFREFRKEYNRKNANANFWHLFTPSKFVNHLSLLNFTINAESINKDILATVESDFTRKVTSLADMLAKITKIPQESAVQAAKILKDFRTNPKYWADNAHELFTVETEPQTDAIDRILYKILNYYVVKKGKFGMEDFIDTLLNNLTNFEYTIQKDLEILKISNGNFLTETTFYEKYDKLIETTKPKVE